MHVTRRGIMQAASILFAVVVFYVTAAAFVLGLDRLLGLL